MKLKLHFRYWILPILITLPLLVMYFSGVPWALEILNPSGNWKELAPTGYWEIGPIENIQLLLLILILIISLMGIRKKHLKIEKISFICIAAFTVFVFLEEIDYGYHFLKFFKGQTETFFVELTGHRNLHNHGENTAKLFKRPIYSVMAIIFIVAPLMRNKIKNTLLLYLTPHKGIILTAIITILSYGVPRLLVDLNIFEDGGMRVWGNIGEFSEILVYYIFFIYLYEIIFEKSLKDNTQ